MLMITDAGKMLLARMQIYVRDCSGYSIGTWKCMQIYANDGRNR